MSLDLAPPLRTALITDLTISGLITEWQTEPAVFTRMPVPDDAQYPMIVVGPDVLLTDNDALNSDRPVVVRDITVYGRQEKDYRDVEMIAYLIRELFHRERFSITVTGYDVVLITAQGPIPAPASDDSIVGRVVTLTIQLRETP